MQAYTRVNLELWELRSQPKCNTVLNIFLSTLSMTYKSLSGNTDSCVISKSQRTHELLRTVSDNND